MNEEKSQENGTYETTGLEIAVIGMAGRFPGARSTHEFWENLKNGVESIRFFSDEEVLTAGTDPKLLENPNYVKARGVLDDVEYFEPAFFNFTPLEAEIMDPQLRIFLECAWHAFEDAGYNPQDFDGPVGVYAGNAVNHYWIAKTMFTPKYQVLGKFKTDLYNTHFSTRVSYHLNLKGPSMTINTACSTSLVAIHNACLALISSECDMALAGGSSISLPQESGYMFQEGMILSPDGHCRAFDARAKGTVGGSGCAVVLLKRLEDALEDGDHIYAIVKGTAINNDGYRKVGYTAPSIDGQAEVIRAAYLMAEVDPQTISYIETHGTGTELGDPVEIEALNMVFKNNKKQSIPIGSVKTYVGHLDTAAGATGFIKTVLALHHQQIPPSLHFEKPNPKIDFENSPFFVNTQCQDWENPLDEDGQQIPLRAGVSSFGLGGTNAHAILQQWGSGKDHSLNKSFDRTFSKVWSPAGAGPGGHAPAGQTLPSHHSSFITHYLLLLSARTPASLDLMVRNLAKHVQEFPHLDPDDLAYTLRVGRKSFPYRMAISCSMDANSSSERTAPLLEKLLEIVKSKEERQEQDTPPGAKDKKRPAIKMKGVKSSFVKNQDPPVIFLLSGQGSQYVDMGRELYRNIPFFQEEMDRCFEILDGLLDYSIKDVLYPHPPTPQGEMEAQAGPAGEAQALIDQTENTQPVVFAFGYVLAKLLMKGGIQPRAMIGYSLGEYLAACLAGVISLEDALRLVVKRGRLMQQAPAASMLSVPLPEKELQPLLAEESAKGISLAIVNGPSCVITGEPAKIRAFEEQMKARRLLCTPVNMGHAVHTEMMETIREEFESYFKEIELSPPRIPYISNVTATWMSQEQAVDPAYWGTHLCQTVRFSAGIQTLLEAEKDNAVFIEIGAGRLLSNILRQHENRQPTHRIVNVIRHQQENASDVQYLQQKIVELWLTGVKIDWTGLYDALPGKRYRLSLPTYPFDRQRYWHDGNPMAALQSGVFPGVENASGPSQGSTGVPASVSQDDTNKAVVANEYEPIYEYDDEYVAPRDELEQNIAQLWQEFLGFERIGIDRNFFDINGDSLTATQLITRLQQLYPVEIPLQSFFEEPTIAHLAQVVRELLIEKVKSLSEEELDELST